MLLWVTCLFSSYLLHPWVPGPVRDAGAAEIPWDQQIHSLVWEADGKQSVLTECTGVESTGAVSQWNMLGLWEQNIDPVGASVSPSVKLDHLIFGIPLPFTFCN